MHYSQSLRYLNRFLNLERICLQENNRLWNLERMEFLLEWFGHPEKNFFPVIIAGTKGKGSTGFFLESILLESGVPAGFYNSPHLEEPTERIRLSGRPIPVGKWVEGVSAVQRVLRKKRLPSRLGDFTYFEILTLLGILVFSKEKIRIGIFEVGMGGRLDATNILKAPLVILTPVSLDHEEILGSTLSAIAREKAGVIHRGAEVVVGEQPKPAMIEIRKKARQMNARLWKAPGVRGAVGLTGDFQRFNAGLAVKAAEILQGVYRIPVHERAVSNGLKRRNWSGRWEIFERRRRFLLDGAHNPASIEVFVRNLKREFPSVRSRVLIFGVSRDKKCVPMLKTLSAYFEDIILVSSLNPRSLEMYRLLAQSRSFLKRIFPAGSVSEAFSLAGRLAKGRSLIVGTGSFYLIGAMRRRLRTDRTL